MPRRRRYKEINVLGGIPSAFELEHAPQEVTSYLNSTGLLSGLNVKAKNAVCSFYFLIKMQLFHAEVVDAAPVSGVNWGPASSPLRQKLYWMTKRLSTVLDAARSEHLRGTQLLVQAQENLALFEKQLVRTKARRQTGKTYLSQGGWMARPQVVSYVLFVLLQKHSKPRLTKREIWKRISVVHSELFGLNLEPSSILKHIERFAGDNSFGDVEQLLTKLG